MKGLHTWKLIFESLQKGIPVMLLYVVDSVGSSPGRKGFMMAVNASAELEGSLGGGIMEHKFVEMAKAKLQTKSTELSIHKQVHNKSASSNQSGMICSGEQTIVLCRVHETDLLNISAIIKCLEENRNGILQLSPQGIQFMPDGSITGDFNFSFISTDDWLYAERLGYKNHLYIIGAGHCALALSQIMRMMDFHIHLFDDRRELKTMTQNEFVHEKTMVEDYSTLSELIPAGENRFVVIMTVGYRTDAVAVQALINKEFRYLGLLGSRSKIDKMTADLRSMNYDEERITRVHAPVGLPIKSQTPEEVAVSVAAEIIQVKNGAVKASPLANKSP